MEHQLNNEHRLHYKNPKQQLTPPPYLKALNMQAEKLNLFSWIFLLALYFFIRHWKILQSASLFLGKEKKTYGEPDFDPTRHHVLPLRLEVSGCDDRHTGQKHPRQNHQTPYHTTTVTLDTVKVVKKFNIMEDINVYKSEYF